MRKFIILPMLLLMTLAYSQTSREEIRKITKEQSDGVLTAAQLGTKTVYNDGKDVVSTVYKDAKSLSPKIVQGINEIAKGLKIGAESVWLILVKQQKVWSICFLILTIASIFNWYMFYRRNLKIIYTDKVGKKTVKSYIDNPEFNEDYYKMYKHLIGSEYSSDKAKINSMEFKKYILVTNEEDCFISVRKDDQFQIFKYVHLSLCIMLSGFSAFHFGDMLTGFMNPEYGAMRDILFVAIKLK